MYLNQKKEATPTAEWKTKAKEFSFLKVIADNTWDSDINALAGKSNYYIYDRHFQIYRENKIKNGENPILFHEAIEKNSSDFVHIFSPPKIDTVYGMVEAAMLKVLIIDERVAERCFDRIMKNTNDVYNAENLYGGNTRLHAAKKAGIFICTHIDTGNGAEKPIHKVVSDKESKITVQLEGNKNGYLINSILKKDKENEVETEELNPNLIIIHQGIIEDFLKVPNIEKFLDKLRKFAPYIVINSGRGIPQGLPSTEKFIPFSLLEDWVMGDRISKYSMVKFLMRLNRRAL